MGINEYGAPAPIPRAFNVNVSGVEIPENFILEYVFGNTGMYCIYNFFSSVYVYNMICTFARELDITRSLVIAVCIILLIGFGTVGLDAVAKKGAKGKGKRY